MLWVVTSDLDATHIAHGQRAWHSGEFFTRSINFLFLLLRYNKEKLYQVIGEYTIRMKFAFVKMVNITEIQTWKIFYSTFRIIGLDQLRVSFRAEEIL